MLIALNAVRGGSRCRVLQHPGQHARMSLTTNDAGRVREHGS